MSRILWCMSFSVLLTSLSLIISKSIHVAVNGLICFFFMAKEYSIGIQIILKSLVSIIFGYNLNVLLCSVISM